MKNITPTEIFKGNQRQAELEETDQSFENQDSKLGARQRMAGPQGARAIELLNDPQAQADTKRWMDLFGLSNEGAQFEQAKIQKAQMGMI